MDEAQGRPAYSGNTGAAIREFRRRVGLTQGQLAPKLEVSERYVRELEKGRQPGHASLRSLVAVMRAAGEFELAACVRQTDLSGQDFRELETRLVHFVRRLDARLTRMANDVVALRGRVASLEALVRREKGLHEWGAWPQPEQKSSGLVPVNGQETGTKPELKSAG